MKAHRMDGVSLVFGLLFVLMSAWWLVDGFAHFTIPDVGWLTPAALIAVGLIGIVASLRSNRRNGEPVSAAPATATYLAAPPPYAPPLYEAPLSEAPLSEAPRDEVPLDEPTGTAAPEEPSDESR